MGAWRLTPPPKNSKCKNRLEKLVATIYLFFGGAGGQDGILLIDYLPKGQIINAEYYSSLLVQLKDILKEKRREKVTKGFLFLHDNAPAHQALATQKKLTYLGFQCPDHPSYSPNLARRTTTCSLDWKKQMKGRHFSSDAEAIAAAKTWLDGQSSDFF